MSAAPRAPVDALSPGHRIPNFALPVADGRMLIFYEFATGQPLLLGACAPDWSPGECARFAEMVQGRAKHRALPSVVIGGAIEEVAAPESSGVTVFDAQSTLRPRLFGDAIQGTDGVLLVLDPNLRVLNGAVVEQPGLEGAAATEGMDTLVERSLEAFEAERAAGPSVAPVLVVPRVLSPELCRGLIEGFARWSPTPSPMPRADGTGLAVDALRKSRLDVVIDDADLEREVMLQIVNRITPELHKAFAYRATRLERLKLVCYRAEDSGHFGAHRDNTAPTTAHRRFALTINLNSGDYDGGQLEFPEYGVDCTYDVPTGSAILFSGTHAHRVRPVTRGERFALISFAFGDDAVTARRPSTSTSD